LGYMVSPCWGDGSEMDAEGLLRLPVPLVPVEEGIRLLVGEQGFVASQELVR